MLKHDRADLGEDSEESLFVFDNEMQSSYDVSKRSLGRPTLALNMSERILRRICFKIRKKNSNY